MLTVTKGVECFTDPQTYILPIAREHLFQFLAPGAVAAEIGVLDGRFSEYILGASKPSKLHLVDLWEFQDDERYQLDPSNATPNIQRERYQAVLAKFAGLQASGHVSIHRGYSHDVAATFSSGYFDWVYVDANHTYDAVLCDLRAYAPKVKDDGLIIGHDHTNHPYAKECHFGVVEAVRDFCAESGARLIALTGIDQFPTYIIAKRADSSPARELLARLFYSVRGIIEVRNFFDRYFRHRTVEFSDLRQNQIISI